MTHFEKTLNKFINDTLSGKSTHITYGDIVGGDKASNGSCIIKNGLTNDVSTKYPFYNIVEQDETHWTIEFALAGYTKDDISVSVDEGYLIVTGKRTEDEDKKYLHKGIALRSFKKSIRLHEWHIIRACKMSDGVLSIGIELVVPEDRKPKTINID